jgi:hypothetical protein
MLSFFIWLMFLDFIDKNKKGVTMKKKHVLKWPSNLSCDIILKMHLQGVQLITWELFNESSYVGIMILQSCEICNLAKLKIFKIPSQKSKDFLSLWCNY